MTGYEEVPYESLPVPESHPARLEALGWLFGLDPADCRSCRVLELGCANGGNLVPMAAYLPGSRFHGIDLYANQVADGHALIQAAGLRNITLEQGDIAELDAGALGVFDYVICHGVYSWVPDRVREAILRLCAAVLAPQGIAYVSYNTLPGWRMRGMLRDMLGHVTCGMDSPGARIGAMYGFFDRMERALTGLDALSAQYLATEIRRLRPRPVGYLVHEFLEPENRALLFTEFAAAATGAGLRYVCDADLSTRHPELVGDGAAAALDDLRDPMEREQHLDFIVNRNFRRSLLCRSDAGVLSEPRLERVEGMQAACDLAPPRKLDLRKTRPAPFARRDGSTIDVSHPLTKAAIARLGRCYPQSLGIGDLLEEARREVRAASGGVVAEEVEHLLPELYSLAVLGAVELLRQPRAGAPARLERPVATALAIAVLGQGRRELPTRQHTALAVDGFVARLLAHLDGTRGIDEVTAMLWAEIGDGRLQVAGVSDGKSDGRGRALVEGNVRRLVDLFAGAGLLGEGEGAAH